MTQRFCLYQTAMTLKIPRLGCLWAVLGFLNRLGAAEQ